MNRTRIPMAGVAVIATAAVAVLGGAFGGGTDERRPPARSRQPRDQAVLSRLLSGLAGDDTAAYVSRLERRLSRTPRRSRHAAAARLRLPAARPRDGRPKLLLTLRARVPPRAALARRRPTCANTGLAALAVSRHRFGDGDPARPRGASRRPEERHRLRRAGRCPPEPRPLPERVRRLRPDGRALAERRLLRPHRPRPGADRPAAAPRRRPFGSRSRSTTRVLEHRAAALVQLGNISFGTGRLERRAPRVRRSPRRAAGPCARARPASLASRRRAAGTDALPRSGAGVVARLPLPQYAIWQGDVLQRGGKERRGPPRLRARRGHRSGSRRRTACAPSSRRRSSISTTAAAWTTPSRARARSTPAHRASTPPTCSRGRSSETVAAARGFATRGGRSGSARATRSSCSTGA